MVNLLLKGKEQLDCNEIEVELLNHAFRIEDKREQRGEFTNSSEALFTRGRQGKDQGARGRSKSRARYKSKGRFKSNERGEGKDNNKGPYYARGLAKDQCAICRGFGHWAKDCPDKSQAKPKYEKKDSRVNIAKETTSGEDSDYSLVVSSSVCSIITNEWILDSGCFGNCFPHRDWISSFTPLDTGVVLLGDDSACRTEGIGNIRVKMHDDMIRELVDVSYVSTLKKNLISLGMLEKKGYKVVLEMVE